MISESDEIERPRAEHLTTVKHADTDRPAVVLKWERGCGASPMMVTTPRSGHWIAGGFIGGVLSGLPVTSGEESSLRRFYGFGKSNDHPIIQNGDMVSLARHAERDAMRLIVYLAKHLERGEDPVKLLVRWHRCAAEQGEAGPVEPEDLEWAEEV